MGGALSLPHAQVECRSEHTYAQQPVAVWWQGQRLAVEALESEWLTPRGRAFRLRCAQNLCFVAAYDQAEDRWEVTLL